MPETTEWARKRNTEPAAVAYGRAIHEVVRAHPYTRALEIGAAWGISTMAILTAQLEGHLTSVDVDPGVQAIREVEANGLADRWTFVCMDSRDFWARNRDTFDLIYVDGNHSHDVARIDLFQAWRVLEPGGTLLVDDVLHPANVQSGVSSEGYDYGVAFAAWQLIAAERLTTVGSEGRLIYLPKAS